MVPATHEPSAVDCAILDGAAVVKFLEPTGVETFAFYTKQLF